jgi:type VI secretion system secreted protein VgrG
METNAIQIGQVTQIGDDPTGNSRVQVTIPAVSGAPVWARLSHSYASCPSGAANFPEVGDEVVIALIDGDPFNPVILGSLFSAMPIGL